MAKKHTSKPKPKFKVGDKVKIIHDQFNLVEPALWEFEWIIREIAYDKGEQRYWYFINHKKHIYRLPMFDYELQIKNSSLVKKKLGLK